MQRNADKAVSLSNSKVALCACLVKCKKATLSEIRFLKKKYKNLIMIFL